MSHGSGFTEVSLLVYAVDPSVRSLLEPRGFNPHRTHRNACCTFDVHSVDNVCTAAFMGLVVSAGHAVLITDDVGEKVIAAGDQITDRSAPVMQETLALVS